VLLVGQMGQLGATIDSQCIDSHSERSLDALKTIVCRYYSIYVVVVEVYISFHGGALSTHLLLQCTQARAFAWQHLNHIKKEKKNEKT